MRNSLCFVLMPFGQKPDGTGRTINFDAVYEQVIAPAIAYSGLEAIRADKEQTGGIIHKAMFERLVLCAYAVADLTTANANVYYELGVRHAIRPWRTALIFAEGIRLPFDTQDLRGMPYRLDAAGLPAAALEDRQKLAQVLRSARAQAADPTDDSPVYQFLDYLPRTEVPHEKTDTFRDQVKYSEEAKRALAAAREQKTAAAVDEALRALRPLPDLEAAVLVDAMLSYRAVSAWTSMIDFVGRLPAEIRETVLVQEQLGFALNRAGRGDEAEKVLVELVKQRGASPETLGILGRVYKDRWERAIKAGDLEEAAAHLDRAIDTYVSGFEADFRDAYPGVNAVTLMEIKAPPDPRREELHPIIRYAVLRKMASKRPDYWDHATLLELAALRRDAQETSAQLGRSLAAMRETWEPETTARNLSLIRKARAARNEPFPPADDAERKLLRKAGKDETLA